MIGDSC